MARDSKNRHSNSPMWPTTSPPISPNTISLAISALNGVVSLLRSLLFSCTTYLRPQPTTTVISGHEILETMQTTQRVKMGRIHDITLRRFSESQRSTNFLNHPTYPCAATSNGPKMFTTPICGNSKSRISISGHPVSSFLSCPLRIQ